MDDSASFVCKEGKLAVGISNARFMMIEAF
jgi:hypothetical protein